MQSCVRVCFTLSHSSAQPVVIMHIFHVLQIVHKHIFPVGDTSSYLLSCRPNSHYVLPWWCDHNIMMKSWRIKMSCRNSRPWHYSIQHLFCIPPFNSDNLDCFLSSCPFYNEAGRLVSRVSDYLLLLDIQHYMLHYVFDISTQYVDIKGM